MISFETYIEISVDDLDLLYSGFFYIQETGSWTSVDSAQQLILHGVIWDNFFVASDTTVCYFFAGSGISSRKKLDAQGHQGTILKKTRCTHSPGWKVVGHFFSLFWYGICCKLAFQTHKHSLNSYRLLCPAMRRTRHSHSESLIPLHTSLSSEYLSFFSTTIIIQWNNLPAFVFSEHCFLDTVKAHVRSLNHLPVY